MVRSYHCCSSISRGDAGFRCQQCYQSTATASLTSLNPNGTAPLLTVTPYSDTFPELYIAYVGGCQNDGPFLGTQNIRRRIIMGIQKGTIILTATHVERKAGSAWSGGRLDVVAGSRCQIEGHARSRAWAARLQLSFIAGMLHAEVSARSLSCKPATTVRNHV